MEAQKSPNRGKPKEWAPNKYAAASALPSALSQCEIRGQRAVFRFHQLRGSMLHYGENRRDKKETAHIEPRHTEQTELRVRLEMLKQRKMTIYRSFHSSASLNQQLVISTAAQFVLHGSVVVGFFIFPQAIRSSQAERKTEWSTSACHSANTLSYVWDG